MAMKLQDCDPSDMGLWANNVCADNLIRKVSEMREHRLRDMIKDNCKNRDESAAIVRSIDLILGLFEEARKMR